MINKISRKIIWNRRSGNQKALFHPRATAVNFPDEQFLLMTCQELNGSDFFSPVLFSIADLDAANWSSPKPVPGMGAQEIGDSISRSVCDVVPEFHRQSGTILAIGHCVYYKNGAFLNAFEAGLQIHPVYSVMNHKKQWSKSRIFKIPELNDALEYTCGCSQRVTLTNGDIIIPFYFTYPDREDRQVCTFRFSFDGKELVTVSSGNKLSLPVNRGLLEPSVVFFGNQFYMTIRAEDSRGYLSLSDDGLNWEKIIPWRWDNGEVLDMSTTQQHWFELNGKLHLAYTRKTDSNHDVFRWRGPIFAAEFDENELCLIKASERIVFPLIRENASDGTEKAALMGNFHCTNISASKVIITVGECRSFDHCRGDTLLAIIE